MYATCLSYIFPFIIRIERGRECFMQYTEKGFSLYTFPSPSSLRAARSLTPRPPPIMQCVETKILPIPARKRDGRVPFSLSFPPRPEGLLCLPLSNAEGEFSSFPIENPFFDLFFVLAEHFPPPFHRQINQSFSRSGREHLPKKARVISFSSGSRFPRALSLFLFHLDL